MSAINWLGAWLLFILILLAIVQTKVGNAIVYYILWLAIIFLIVTNYQQITDILQAGGIVPASHK
jgi:hypothetical protein